MKVNRSSVYPLLRPVLRRPAGPRLVRAYAPTHGSSPAPALPSRPRPSRPRELPEIKSRTPLFIGLGVLGLSAWGAFLLYAMNQERLSSSVVQQILSRLRMEPRLVPVLGQSVRFEPQWYAMGSPYVSGAVNLLQGNVDVSFRIQGSRGKGTVYFTSIRHAKGAPFTILRFKVICDDGTVVSLLPNDQ